MKDFNSFEYSKGKNMNCEKCHGKGWYIYTTRGTPHGKPCEVCCDHGKGFWILPITMENGKRVPDDQQSYGEDAGKECCLVGCGYVKK